MGLSSLISWVHYDHLHFKISLIKPTDIENCAQNVILLWMDSEFWRVIFYIVAQPRSLIKSPYL